MLNLSNRCCSNDIVFSVGKAYDRFRILLGSGYSFRLGNISKINTSVKFEYAGIYYPHDVLEQFEANTPANDVESNVDEDRVGGVPFIPMSIGDRLVQNGVGAANQPGSSFGNIPNFNPGNYQPGNTIQEFGGSGYFNWNIAPVFQDFQFFGVGESGSGNQFQQFETGQGVPELPVPNFADFIPKIPRITPENIQNQIYLPPVNFTLNGDDYYSVNLSFNPVVQVKRVVKDFGDWVAYQCRLYVPEFAALLAANNKTAENYFNFVPTSDGEQYSNYVGYISGLRDAVAGQIASKTVYKHYAFSYDLPIGFGDNVPSRNIEIDAQYNYYNQEFEERVGAIAENQIASLYDIFSSKSFDSRVQTCQFRRKTVCLEGLKGTERNVLYVADDLGEVSYINSITEESDMVPFGSMIKLPVRYSSFNNLLKNNSLLTRMGLDVFDGIASKDSDFANVESAFIFNNVQSLIKNTVFVDASQWLEGVKKLKFNKFDYEGFPVTIYDFGQVGQNISLNIDNDLSTSSKSVLAAATEDEIRDSLQRDVLDFWNVDFEHSKRFGYYVQKLTDNFNVQKFLTVTSNDFESTLNLFDMQVKFDKNYKYIVDAVEAFPSSEYYYGEDLGGRFLDPIDGSVYFTLYIKNKMGILDVPLVEKEIKIVDAFPVPPEVTTEQFRDSKNECLFLLNSGIGEKKEKFVALNDNDLAIFNDYKNKVSEEIVDGLIKFKSDDPAIGFEVYGADVSPKSYLDFVKLAYVDNVIYNNNNKIILASNSFKITLTTDKLYYFFVRQIDVHGKPSNPTNIYRVKFDGFGERSVMSTDVLTSEEVFNSGKIINNVKNLRRYLFVKAKQDLMKTNNFWEKEYRFKLISKKTFKECNIDAKFVVKNDDLY